MASDTATKNAKLQRIIRRRIEEAIARVRELDRTCPKELRNSFLKPLVSVDALFAPFVADFRDLFAICRKQGLAWQRIHQNLNLEFQRQMNICFVRTPEKGSTRFHRSTLPMDSTTYEVEPTSNSEVEPRFNQQLSEEFQDIVCVLGEFPTLEEILSPEYHWTIVRETSIHLSPDEYGVDVWLLWSYLERATVQAMREATTFEDKADLEGQLPLKAPATLGANIGANIKKYMDDSRLTVAQLAAKVADGDAKAVRAHIANKRKPRPITIQSYESVFSERLGSKINLLDLTQS